MLAILDGERRSAVREWSPDRTECRIVYAPTSLVRDEQERARAGGYTLEWKVYGHDAAPELPEALAAAGFTAGDIEAVLGLDLDDIDWDRFKGSACETRVLLDESSLVDVAAISRQIGRRDVEAETRRLAAMMRDRPNALGIHVAYVAGQPVSCGRIHYGNTPGVAELAGGRTVTTHRRQGLFTAIVASRLREAAARGCRYAFVDALPTSEPILTGLGFVALTTTQPFTYEP